MRRYDNIGTSPVRESYERRFPCLAAHIRKHERPPAAGGRWCNPFWDCYLIGMVRLKRKLTVLTAGVLALAFLAKAMSSLRPPRSPARWKRYPHATLPPVIPTDVFVESVKLPFVAFTHSSCTPSALYQPPTTA